VRQLPSAKVCFLGGCPRRGRNQDPAGAFPRSRRPPRRRALDCLHSRCLRVKAAEKAVKTTTPLRLDFWRPKFRPCGTRDLDCHYAVLEGQGGSVREHGDSRGPAALSTLQQKGAHERKDPEGKLPRQ
jgi:hypothetical protein